MLLISDMENSELHLQNITYARAIARGCITYGINSPERKAVMSHEIVKDHSTNLVCYKFPKYLKLYVYDLFLIKSMIRLSFITFLCSG